jgi:hypothetical protein
MRFERRILRGTVAALWLGIFFTAGPRAGQSGGPPTPQGAARDRAPAVRTGTAVLKGRVVDGLTGVAVARARVRLMGSAGARPPVLSDETGAFSFRDLPAGVYSLSVEKSTYMTATYPDRTRSLRERSTRPLLVRDGAVVGDVTVPIYRGGAITGRVVDAHGDPVEYAEVRVTKVTGSGAGRPVGGRGGSGTNDLGEFRLGRLEPGQYLLMVVSQRRGMEEFAPNAPNAPNAAALPQPLPTFYPNTLAASEAQPIVVERGQTVSNIEVMMAEGVPTIVRGVIVNDEGQPMTLKGGGGSVNARLMGREFSGGWVGNGGAVRSDGTFRLTLGPGNYILEAHVSGPPDPAGSYRPENQLMGMTRMTVDGESMDVSIVVGRGATASGRVVFEGTTPPPAPPQVPRMGVPMQSPDGGNCRSGQLQLAPDWTFKIEGLFGTCGAPSYGSFGRWMLKTVTIDGHDVTRETLTFQPGQHYDKVQVVVTDRRLELNLRVSDEKGQPTRDYVALVFPVDSRQWTDFNPPVRTYAPQPIEMVEQLRASGVVPPAGPSAATLRREAVMGLMPGDYYAVAIDDIDAESSRDPAVLERLATSATRVSLVEGATEVVLRRLRLADVLR